MKIPIEISARHVHLSKSDFERLFGKGKQLHPIKSLSQEGEFASKEEITIIDGKSKIENLRILGPFREKSQIELSITDCYKLKLNPMPKIKVSGDVSGTTKILAKGDKGHLKLPVIIAKRHLHCSEKDGKRLNLRNNQLIKIKVSGKRALIFDNIVVRIKPDFNLACHLDTDEANAAGIFHKCLGKIVK